MAEKEAYNILVDLKKASDKVANEQTQSIKDTVNELLSAEVGEDLAKPLAALLALDDEQFKTLSPMVLVSINKDLHDSNNQLAMLNAFNAQGVTLDDLHKDIDELAKTLDTPVEGLSKAKCDFIKQILYDIYNAISEIKGIPKRIIEIPLEICNKDAKMPAYAHATDAGLDVYALEDITIAPGETKLIPLGIKVAIPVGYEIQVRPKSGRCLKTKLRVANAPGTIDAGYRDELGVIIDNIEAPIKKIYFNDAGKIECEYGSSYTIGKGEKFAQLVLSDIQHAQFYEVESVAEIGEDRGGGYGSTGLK